MLRDNPSRARYHQASSPNASHTTWIAAALVGLLLIGGFALFNSGGNRSTSAIMPDATTGQGTPAKAPPINR